MNSKFPIGYGIDVSYRQETSIPVGQQFHASKGILHYAWGGTSLWLWSDEDVSSINAKIRPGYRLEVGYKDAVDYHQIKVSPEAATCWKPGDELVLSSHTRWDKDKQIATIL